MKKVGNLMKGRILALTLKLRNRGAAKEEIHFARECVDTSERTQMQKMLETQTLESTKRYASGSAGLVLIGNNYKHA